MKKFLAVLCLLSLCACAPTAALPEGAAEGGRQVPVEAPPGETAEALGPEIQTIPASPLPTPGIDGAFSLPAEDGGADPGFALPEQPWETYREPPGAYLPGQAPGM